MYGLDWSVLVLGPMQGYCEDGNKPSGSIEWWEVLE
jgi:hypothetical protein